MLGPPYSEQCCGRLVNHGAGLKCSFIWASFFSAALGVCGKQAMYNDNPVTDVEQERQSIVVGMN